MKAVIMAGGEGRRLRPMTCNYPKPMARLFDRPVMEYIVKLLKKHGITDIAVTLQYMPKMIEDHFGDGSEYGVSIRYYREECPLGTAGSVAQCADFLDEDFIVISGDAVCDFDLNAVIEFHKRNNADVTLALYKHPTPLEYGLVMTDESGRVERFIEKPTWGEVFTDTVNTGIYVLSPKVLDAIPKREKYDFACDLFPRLKDENARLYGFIADGYWCDIGECEAMLECTRDVLDGKVKLDIPAKRIREGIYSASRLEHDIKLIPPCYIGSNVTMEKGVQLGPYAVIGEGSVLGKSAVVERSICDGGKLMREAELFGSIVCRNAVIGNGAGLGEGTVIGENARIGDHCVVFEGVRIWPDKFTQDGERIRYSILPGTARHYTGIGEDGVIRGEINIDLSPEACVMIGNALGTRAGRGQKVLVGCDGENASCMAIDAIRAGVRTSGAVCAQSDSSFASELMFASSLIGARYSVFARLESNGISIRLFGSDGMKLENAERRKIEGAVSRGDCTRADSMGVGDVEYISGIGTMYASSALVYGSARGRSVSLAHEGDKNSAQAALYRALEEMGMQICEYAVGIPFFDVDDDGLELIAVDEKRRNIDNDHTEAIAVLCALRLYDTVAVQYSASSVLDMIATREGRALKRIGKDGASALKLYHTERYLWDAVARASFICAYMAREGVMLSELYDEIPSFWKKNAELPLESDRGYIMRALKDEMKELSPELCEGMKFVLEEGYIHIYPCSNRQAIRIIAESGKEEYADELCTRFEKSAQRLDRKAQRSVK